ncbi:MAG: dihydroorotase [Oenococcus sp.]|uniref:dihydroorotase n=1 Tax=Oenococcus TaxID=46254 RepID=UPI0021E9A134|nr:dihydroorotase [Oenococcus kitaharae]MCV3296811.1 dihydroorotase [Oenococcus kitaharae]
MPTILIKNARVLAGENQLIKQDVLIENTYIKQVADMITVSADQVIDAENALLLPGLIDVHVHFREPGFSEKETVASGSKAAARGGFTTVLAMPNVNPVVDNPDVLRQMLALNQRDGIAKIHQYAAISAGLDSDHVDDLDALAQAGAVAFTNDGKGVQTADTMYEAMKAAARLGKVLVAHVEDDSLIHGGVMNAGPAADALGLTGANKLSESSQLARDLVIAQATGVRYHVAHVSTAESVALIRIAKKEGVHVTAEVSPHHLLLDDGMITKDDAMMKMNPPLRSPHDRAALIAGLLDGTIDMVATDHAPHTAAEKAQGMLKAPNGVTGIETSFQLLYTHFVKSGVMSLRRLLQVMNQAPAAAFSLSDAAVKVAAGQKADLALFDIDHPHVISKDEFASKASNSPFIGWEIYGQTQATWVNGQQVYAAERSQA